MSKIEKAQVYFAIALLIIAHMYEIRTLMGFSAGIFLGSSFHFFFNREVKNELF